MQLNISDETAYPLVLKWTVRIEIRMCLTCHIVELLNYLQCGPVCVFWSQTLLHCLLWQPSSIEFEEMNWYETLMFYGYQEDEDPAVSSHDADQKLMPSLVERVVLPKLIGK